MLLYGVTGTTSVQEINSNLTADVGKILVTISLLFKLSAVPFYLRYIYTRLTEDGRIIDYITITSPQLAMMSSSKQPSN